MGGKIDYWKKNKMNIGIKHQIIAIKLQWVLLRKIAGQQIVSLIPY